MIFYVTDKGTVTQALEGVKGVRDFGEYYVLIFRGFEELFDGKIVRKQSN